MKIKDNKIMAATEQELFDYWVNRGFDEIYSFPEYLEKMKEHGVKITT